jgi:hypothetical protein
VAQRAALAAVLTLLAAAGCSSGTNTSAQPSTSSTSATSAAAAQPSPTTDAVPFPADTSPDGGPADDGGDPHPDPDGIRVTRLELSTEDGFDRLVVQLDGAGVPRWDVAYNGPENSNGAPVTIAGDAFLLLTMQVGTQSAEAVPSVSGSGLIAEAADVGLFEGFQDVMIGVRGGELPFRAFAMTDPGRIVVDVRLAG